MPANLEILHGAVGPHRQGDVVPVSAITGGYPEADRLVGMGAAKWTATSPTVELPAVADAVMEMTDDELLAENRRLNELLAARDEMREAEVGHLKNQLAVVTAQRDELLKELEAARKGTPARRGRAKKADDAPVEPATVMPPLADGATEYQQANPPADNSEQPSLSIPEPDAEPAAPTE